MSSQISSEQPKLEKEPSWWWLLLTPILFVVGLIGTGLTHGDGVLGASFIMLNAGSVVLVPLCLLIFKLDVREKNNRPYVKSHGVSIIRQAPDPEAALTKLEEAGWNPPTQVK